MIRFKHVRDEAGLALAYTYHGYTFVYAKHRRQYKKLTTQQSIGVSKKNRNAVERAITDIMVTPKLPVVTFKHPLIQAPGERIRVIVNGARSLQEMRKAKLYQVKPKRYIQRAPNRDIWIVLPIGEDPDKVKVNGQTLGNYEETAN